MARYRNADSARARRRRPDKDLPVGHGHYRTAGLLVFVLVVSIAGLALLFTTRRPAAHPGPRYDANAEDVIDSSRYADRPRVQQAYQLAAAIPTILDGLHCYCECARHSGHYSLLDCFKTNHSEECDICLRSAVLAYELYSQGKSLNEIRAAVDELFT